MTQEVRLAIINDLIEEAKRLATKPYNSPSVDLWENRVKRFVRDEYDEETVFVFERAILGGVIVEDGMQQEAHEGAMERGVEFLDGLKSEPVPEKPIGVLGRLLQAEKEQTKRQHHTQVEYNIYGGTVHTGNGNIEQNVTVRDIIFQISDEVSKLPESQEKKSVLQALKAITTNDTFASVSGALIGTLLGKIVNPAG